jgi:type I restriction enzyme M protein
LGGADLRAHGRERKLAQFFTPVPVVRLAWDLLEWLGAKVDGARIVDPACGDGVWLTEALARGRADMMAGWDLDERRPDSWERSGLTADRHCHMQFGNGLLAHAPDEGFDIAVGNPPFGINLADAPARELTAVAATHHLYLGSRAPRVPPLGPSAGDLARLRRFPLELVFLERFVSLCKPGGWLAIVLPEGVAANARWRYVRAWLAACSAMHVVISLPRGTFRPHGTSAATCLMVMRKGPPPPGHEVTLATLTDAGEPACEEVLAGIMSDQDLVVVGLPDGLLPPPLQRHKLERGPASP